MITTYPLDSYDYDASDAAGFFSTRLSGVYSAEEDFAVTASGSTSVTISAGRAWIHPSRWTGYSVLCKDPQMIQLPVADGLRSRIDRVVLRYDAAARQTRLVVLEGTPDSASPAPPELSRTALVYDLCLADIARPAGSAAVTNADLTDTRADEDVCGVMRDGVTGIPTQQLVEQWRAAQAAQAAAAQQKFDAQTSAMQQQSGELSAEIKKLQDGSFYTKEQVDEKLAGLNVNPFGIGAIYQSTDAASPAALFGGTWEQIAENRVLMGVSGTHAAATTAEAGLPNITGSLRAGPYSNGLYPTGAFEKGKQATSVTEGGGSNRYFYECDFSAARSNAIYGRSTTVQPPAYYVYIWRRVA